MPPTAPSPSRKPAKTLRPARKFACRCKPASPLSAPPFPACSWRTTKTSSRPPPQVAADLRPRATPGLFISHRHAHRDPPHQPLSDPRQSSAVCTHRSALPTAQRTRAKINLLTRIHAALHLPRAPRRIRPDPHRDRLTAHPLRKAHPRRLGFAHRFARSPRHRPTTLNNVRSLSQALHPVMLDETGLESTMDWYIPTVEKQTGIDISYQKSGVPFALDGGAAIHIYRVLQEALNNVARHSGAREAQVRLQFSSNALDLEVEDHGKGGVAVAARSGIGLVAMRERAELLHGTIEFTQPPQGGTLVRMRVPREGRRSECRIRFPFSWWTITAWCAAASAACSKTKATCKSRAKPATGKTPCASPANCGPT